MKLFRALRGDPLLLALTVILTLAAWAPLAVTPFLPFPDLHNNSAAASMLVDAARGKGTLGYYYNVNWAPVPYWTGYVLMAAWSAVGGVLFAAKAMVAFLAVILPLSVMRLLIALGRSPRLGLWAFALVWEHNMYSGWVTYLLGMAIALVILALLVEMETLRDALVVLAWTVLVSLTHVQGVALVALAGAGITVLGVLRGKRLGLHVLALAGGALPVLPWVGRHLAPGGHVTKVPFVFDWHPLAMKAGRIFTYTFDHYPKEPEEWAPAFAFTLLLVGPLVLAGTARPRAVRPAHRDGGVVAAIVTISCVVLYAASPYEIRGPVNHFHNYDRYATFALLALLLLPRPDLRGWRALWLLPGLIAALAMDLTTPSSSSFPWCARDRGCSRSSTSRPTPPASSPPTTSSTPTSPPPRRATIPTCSTTTPTPSSSRRSTSRRSPAGCTSPTSSSWRSTPRTSTTSWSRGSTETPSAPSAGSLTRASASWRRGESGGSTRSRRTPGDPGGDTVEPGGSGAEPAESAEPPSSTGP
jgi:hypothetical protein